MRVVASMPCYSKANVDAQRGGGVFGRSIEGLRRLNAVGYGKPGSGLVLDLVYNPGGIFLAPPQAKLEPSYKQARLVMASLQGAGKAGRGLCMAVEGGALREWACNGCACTPQHCLGNTVPRVSSPLTFAGACGQLRHLVQLVALLEQHAYQALG